MKIETIDIYLDSRGEGGWEGSLAKRIEYILEWNLDNPSVRILSVPFSLKGSVQIISYKFSQIICIRVH